MATRWMDNDVYGHVNNVVYYSFFDTAVNAMLIENDLLDTGASPAIGLVVETGCTYAAPLSFPDDVTAGVSVARIGTSSIRYDVALFAPDSDRPAATGHFVHVYVDRDTRRPVPVPDHIRSFLETLTARHADAAGEAAR
ncbi:thioesterase family protein [Sphingomonas sp. BIUV-7]|uniref:Thioesterase family protein n=1 Tax=Sphingomonas natans TaxID=3063330 RepID=A0ABT8Y6Z0_9SPHN|nr:thioesterase family protein [Sphingomonas sp. BIUV-7]MDO6414066.1 thioesterase family protein [Sphingomonas sp. BIUV-7]